MRRSDSVLFVLTCCVACGGRPPLASRPSPAAKAASPAAPAPEHPSLPVLARSGRPQSPVRILAPREGSLLGAAESRNLVVRVQGPSGPPTPSSLELSLDGARPRPVTAPTLGISELLEPGATLANGAHDLVLAAVGADGVVLEPSAGGVTSVRFFVGARPNPPVAPRIVCLAPFGTHYGSAPRIALDIVLVGQNEGNQSAPSFMEVTIEGAGSSRRARAAGRGTFALGDFESGDHVISVVPASGAPPAVPGRCLFSYNRELERAP